MHYNYYDHIETSLKDLSHYVAVNACTTAAKACEMLSSSIVPDKVLLLSTRHLNDIESDVYPINLISSMDIPLHLVLNSIYSCKYRMQW